MLWEEKDLDSVCSFAVLLLPQFKLLHLLHQYKYSSLHTKLVQNWYVGFFLMLLKESDIDHLHLVSVLKLSPGLASIFHMQPHPIIHMVRTKYCIVILDTILSYTRLSR